MTTGRQTMPARGRATFRSKSLVLLGTLLILASMVAIAGSRPGSVLGAGGPNALNQFTVAASVIAPETVFKAGTSFRVTVTAINGRGQTMTAYVGPGVLGGLDESPSGADPSYGVITTWLNGVGTAQVTATRSQAGATVTYTDTATSISGVSGEIAIQPAALAALSFADTNHLFNGQPVDTIRDCPISSVFTPSTTANPCGTPEPVRVLATDGFGNRVANVPVSVAGAGATTSVNTATGTLGVAPYGEAAFADLKITDLGTYELTASSPSLTGVATSDEFEIVADLKLCDGAACKNTGKFISTITPQTTYGSATTGDDFDNSVVLTTSFVDLDEDTVYCAGDSATFGETTEVRVQDATLGGVTAAEPDFSVALLYPRATLQYLDITSRGTPSFQVCLGAIRLDSAAPIWKAKTSANNAALIDATPIDGAYWGWVPDCAAVANLPGNPCITLRTKDASILQPALGLNNADFKKLGYKSGDLAILVSKPWPWDGKFTAR